VTLARKFPVVLLNFFSFIQIQAMPNRKEHQETGAAVGAIVGGLANMFAQYQKQQLSGIAYWDIGELLMSIGIGGAVGACGATLPDLLEPATHPGHRSVCHSVTAVAALAVGLKKLNENTNVRPEVKALTNIAGAGYLSHLLMDGQTPAGLPIFMK
jgi:inner membrane protein